MREGGRRKTRFGSLKARALLLLVPISMLAISACKDSGGGLDPIVPAGGTNIAASEFVSAVAEDSTAGAYTADVMPRGDTTGPMLLGPREYVQGSSALVQVVTDSAATELVIGVANTASGYWTLPLNASAKVSVSDGAYPLPTAEATLSKIAVTEGPRAAAVASSNSWILTITPTGNPGRTSFRLLVAQRTPAGLSLASSHTVYQNNTAVGSDALQVSLNWIDPVDMDLHVETPDGGDIYWAARTGAQGGQLDLDSNPACSLDNVNNENITWLTSTPVPGTYTVRLDLWSACTQPGPFPYIITITVNGETSLYQGELLATDADAGGAHSGQLIETLNIGG